MANMEIKCPCCGGSLEFDQSKQKIVCPYCDSEFTADDLKQYSDDLNEDQKEDTKWDDSQVQAYTDEDTKGINIYSCNSCGGEIICEETTASTTCPYCGNNVLVASRLSGDLKPNYVIPFKNDKDTAVQMLSKHFKKKILLPSSFSKTNTIQEIKPLYVPFWIFDADVDGKVRYRGEKHRTWSDSQYTYRETKYYSIVRSGKIAFDHVPVDGSSKMQDELMESIEPYDFSQAEEFNAAYLAGYAADRYDVTKEVTYNRATERFRDGTAQAFRKDIHGYDDVTVSDTNLRFSNTKSAYALYPVWVLNTKWKDKTFQFAMNGQTGKIAGNLPISKVKFALLAFLFFLIPFALFLFLGLAGSDWNIEDAIGLIIVGIVVGAIISGGIMFLFWKKNKNVHFQYGAAPYVRGGSENITGRKDIYLYSKVSKTRKSSSSSSSSHGGPRRR